MKLLIVGSREITDFDIDKYIAKDVDTILSGGAKGIDRIAEEYADENNIAKIIIRPAYKLYGRAAPLRRNEELVNLSDKVIAVWNGKSKGTQYTIKYAKRIGKSVEIVIADK